MKKILIYTILLLAVISFNNCKKGEAGDPGPIGAKGQTGAAGTPGAIGTAGDKGITGEKGVTGDKGATGDAGADGVANMVTSIWAPVVWSQNISDPLKFNGEVELPEISDDLINKGLITLYFSRKSSNFLNGFEFSAGLFINLSINGKLYKVKPNGYKKGKVLLILESTSTVSVTELNTNPDLYFRIIGIKSN